MQGYWEGAPLFTSRIQLPTQHSQMLSLSVMPIHVQHIHTQPTDKVHKQDT